MKLEKALKAVGEDTAKELEAMSPEQLKERIVNAESAMKQVADELEANPKYQEIKENKKALELGKKEVNARQKAIIALALHHLSKE